MILADGSPALLDWGLAAELDVATRAFLARVVLLLNLRDKRAVREGLVDLECNAKRFTFNAAARDDDPDFVAAFMYQFFDTSAEGVDLDPKLFDRIFYLLQHDPTSFPTLTNCPKEVVLFVRTVSALRRCLRAAGGHRVAASGAGRPSRGRAPGPRARATAGAAGTRELRALDAFLLAVPAQSVLADYYDALDSGEVKIHYVRSAANPANQLTAPEVADRLARTIDAMSGRPAEGPPLVVDENA
ncbi:hypothetical protein SO694_00048061 [Aureococcus anophagefferens]|uniref:Uncharacterized protein n=1 Tax=Aureococcus anophagefferens TaxID=44056 RepID=A0ABR1G875_AURAN